MKLYFYLTLYKVKYYNYSLPLELFYNKYTKLYVIPLKPKLFLQVHIAAFCNE